MFLIEVDGHLAGRMALGGIVRGAFQSAGVGHALDQALTGRGIATIALHLLVRHAFEGLNLHRLQAETQPTNLASGRVLTRCGFEHHGSAAQYVRINGVW